MQALAVKKAVFKVLKHPYPILASEPLWSAHLDWTLAQSGGVLTVESNGVKQEIEVQERDTALTVLLNTLVQGETKILDSLEEIDLVVHRVVHGGAKYSQATMITREVKKALKD